MIVIIDELPLEKRAIFDHDEIFKNQDQMSPGQRDMSIYGHCLLYVFRTRAEAPADAVVADL